MKRYVRVAAADEPTYYVDELGKDAYVKALNDESVRDFFVRHCVRHVR